MSRDRPKMKWLYRLCWHLLRIGFRTYFRWRVVGAERIPLEGPVILASNHASFLDPPLLGAAAPREASFLARESLFRFPLLGKFIRAINALPVDREGKSPKGLKAILDRLAEGKPVVLFPEGTRTADGNLLPARSGVGLTVIKSGAPVVPIRIFGSYEAYSRSMWFPRPRSIRVVFGEPIDFSSTIAEAASAEKGRIREIYAEVADRIMGEIAGLKPDGSTHALDERPKRNSAS